MKVVTFETTTCSMEEEFFLSFYKLTLKVNKKTSMGGAAIPAAADIAAVLLPDGGTTSKDDGSDGTICYTFAVDLDSPDAMRVLYALKFSVLNNAVRDD